MHGFVGQYSILDHSPLVCITTNDQGGPHIMHGFVGQYSILDHSPLVCITTNDQGGPHIGDNEA